MKYDLEKKLLRSMAKNPMQRDKPDRLLNTSSTRNGDIRITRDADGIKLNAKHNGLWYQTRLKRKDLYDELRYYNETSWDVLEHDIRDSSVTANTYHFLTIGSDTGTRVMSTSMNSTTPRLFYTAINLQTIHFAFNSNSTGVYGFKLWLYKNNKSDVTNISNYNEIWEGVTGSMQPGIGVVHNLKVNKELPKNSWIAIQAKAPNTASFTLAKVGIEFKNKFNK